MGTQLQLRHQRGRAVSTAEHQGHPRRDGPGYLQRRAEPEGQRRAAVHPLPAASGAGRPSGHTDRLESAPARSRPRQGRRRHRDVPRREACGGGRRAGPGRGAPRAQPGGRRHPAAHPAGRHHDVGGGAPHDPVPDFRTDGRRQAAHRHGEPRQPGAQGLRVSRGVRRSDLSLGAHAVCPHAEPRRVARRHHVEVRGQQLPRQPGAGADTRPAGRLLPAGLAPARRGADEHRGRVQFDRLHQRAGIGVAGGERPVSVQLSAQSLQLVADLLASDIRWVHPREEHRGCRDKPDRRAVQHQGAAAQARGRHHVGLHDARRGLPHRAVAGSQCRRGARGAAARAGALPRWPQQPRGPAVRAVGLRNGRIRPNRRSL